MDFLTIAWVPQDPLTKTPGTGHLGDEAGYQQG